MCIRDSLCIILAAQFSRAVTHASNIHMSAIADAADIERAAAMVIGLWNGNKGAMVTPSEQKKAKKWDDAAGIVQDPENDGGTVYLKILKYRGGVSERWATYPFKGNRLHIGREPVRCGCGEPYIEPPETKNKSDAGKPASPAGILEVE